MNASFEEIMNYSPENQKVFDELLGLCIKGLIVPYVGAGMSAFRFPLWDRCINEKKSCLGDRANGMNNIDAAEAIEKELGKDVFYKDIQTTFGCYIDDVEWDKIKDDAKDQAVSTIPELFHSPIITTNFDQILEKIHDNISVAFPNNVEELEKVKNNRKPLVYKIHGCVSDVQNIVFTKTAYNEVYAPDTPLVKSLSDFFTSFHFLFLGCSLAIDNSKGSTKEHYIELWEKLQQSGMYHFAILDCANDETIKLGRRKELENKNIRPILYESGKYESVKIILEELLDQIKNQLLKIPEYNTPFTDRTDSIITEITNTLENSKYSVLALSGFGGVGKTRIMSEYAHKVEAETNTKVFWFNAISAENVKEQIRQFVVKYQGLSEEEKDTDKIFDAFRKWTKENENYLFLLDNVENKEDIEIFLSNDYISIKGTRHVLITSRLNEEELENIKIERIEVFEKEEAQSFLQSHTEQISDEYSDKIAELLGYLPLALEQASAYINEEKISYQEYAELIENEPVLDTLDKNHPEYGAVSVRATWNITMQRIRSESAKELLWLCAYFAPDNIHNQWFLDASEVLPPNLKNDIQTQLSEIETQLKKYSLIKIGNNKISIHRLLQEVIRKTFKEKQEKWVDYGINVLHKQIFDDFSTAQSRNEFTEIIPHFISITDKNKKKTLFVAQLYYFLGLGYYEIADYSKSIRYHTIALKIRKKLLPKMYPDMANSYQYIGMVYRNMSEYKNALRWNNKALLIREKKLGLIHPDTADSYNSIGLIWDDRGKYKKSLMWHKKALHIRKKTLGLQHPVTAESYNNIGLAYTNMGRYQEILKWNKKSLITYREALKNHKKSLLIYREILGEKHIYIARNHNNIGLTYGYMRKYKKSLECYQNTLTIYEEKLGKEHPLTALTYNNIGYIYYCKRKYSKSLGYYQQALMIYKKILGEKHSDTARTYNNIAKIYDCIKEYQKALELFVLSYDIFTCVFNNVHPYINNVKNNMRQTYLKTNNPIPFEEWLNEQIKK